MVDSMSQLFSFAHELNNEQKPTQQIRKKPTRIHCQVQNDTLSEHRPSPSYHVNPINMATSCFSSMRIDRWQCSISPPSVPPLLQGLLPPRIQRTIPQGIAEENTKSLKRTIETAEADISKDNIDIDASV